MVGGSVWVDMLKFTLSGTSASIRIRMGRGLEFLIALHAYDLPKSDLDLDWKGSPFCTSAQKDVYVC